MIQTQEKIDENRVKELYSDLTLTGKILVYIFFLPLSDIMDLRHQSSAMCIIMLGGEDTHPWSATNVGNPILATIPVTK